MLGQPVARLFDPGALDRVAALLDRSRASGAGAQRAPGVDPRPDPVLLEVGVVWRASPSPGSSTMYLRDLAEREALVEALAQRAADLARSNRDLEQFAYVASHDLQEPLRMVGSYTQLLSQRYQGKLDAEADEYLGYAHDGVVRMRELIDDLLAFARVGTRAEPFVRLHTEDVVDDALDNLSAAIEGQHATVTRGELPDVVGDAGQLRQLFQNLVANALKFRGPASPKVAVEAVRNGGEWTFSVRDNGIGIPPSSRTRSSGCSSDFTAGENTPGPGSGSRSANGSWSGTGGGSGWKAPGSRAKGPGSASPSRSREASARDRPPRRARSRRPRWRAGPRLSSRNGSAS